MSSLDSLIIEQTINTPEIIFDVENGSFKISGKSMPEDAVEFYKPIVEWVKEFAKTPLSKATFNVELEYFNTASSKLILGIIKTIGQSSSDTCINWYYMEDDEDMQDVGEHLSEILGEGIVNVILLDE